MFFYLYCFWPFGLFLFWPLFVLASFWFKVFIQRLTSHLSSHYVAFGFFDLWFLLSLLEFLILKQNESAGVVMLISFGLFQIYMGVLPIYHEWTIRSRIFGMAKEGEGGGISSCKHCILIWTYQLCMVTYKHWFLLWAQPGVDFMHVGRGWWWWDWRRWEDWGARRRRSVGGNVVF